MKSSKKIAIFIVGFVFIGLLVSAVFPKEREKNPEAQIRIGAGDDCFRDLDGGNGGESGRRICHL